MSPLYSLAGALLPCTQPLPRAGEPITSALTWVTRDVMMDIVTLALLSMSPCRVCPQLQPHTLSHYLRQALPCW